MKKILILISLFYSAISYSSISINYPNVQLDSLVETVSDMTGKSFTFNTEAGQVNVSLVMPYAKDPNIVYHHFVESLKNSGLKAVELDHGLISIVPAGTIVTTDHSTDSFHTMVVSVQSNAGDIAKSLKKSLSVGGYISESGDNKIVIHDLYSNLSKLKRLIGQLDKVDPVIYKSVSLVNLKPSEIKAPEGLHLTSYDKVNRLVIQGVESEVNPFIGMIKELDLSLKTIHARLVVTSMTKTFADEFNLVALFQKGAISTNLKSISYNNLTGFTDGISAVLSLFKEHSQIQILSQPFIQLREHKKGSFNVGREIPILVSTIDKESGQSINNIERKKVGLNIELSSRVRADGKVEIDLTQNLSGISETQLENAKDLITEDQSLSTSLLIEPDKVYAVGGVIDSRNVLKKSELPFFSVLDTDTENNQSQQIVIFIEVSVTH